MTRSKAYLFGGVEIRWCCAKELLRDLLKLSPNRTGLATTRDHSGPVVIVIPAIPHADLPGAGVWWDVAPAEVAEQEAVSQLRAEYEDGLTTQRWHG